MGENLNQLHFRKRDRIENLEKKLQKLSTKEVELPSINDLMKSIDSFQRKHN